MGGTLSIERKGEGEKKGGQPPNLADKRRGMVTHVLFAGDQKGISQENNLEDIRYICCQFQVEFPMSQV